jgi:hypothetical protein
MENKAMQNNRITATLSTADTTAVMDAIDTIRTRLPFLLDLSKEERRQLPKMGDKSRAFVQQALALATQNPNILPRSFDLEEMRRDVELADALQPIMVALGQLQELVDDTYIEVGSEAYTAALMVYQYARAAGQGAALDGLLDDLGQRFARKSRTTTPTSPPAQ